jgi:hypothetical protein
MAQKRLDDTTLRRLNELFQESLALYDSEHGYQPGTRGSYDKTSVPSFDGSRAASYPRLLSGGEGRKWEQLVQRLVWGGAKTAAQRAGSTDALGA